MYTIQRLKYWRLQFPCITLCMVLQISIFQQCTLVVVMASQLMSAQQLDTLLVMEWQEVFGPKNTHISFGNRVAISNNVTICQQWCSVVLCNSSIRKISPEDLGTVFQCFTICFLTKRRCCYRCYYALHQHQSLPMLC